MCRLAEGQHISIWSTGRDSQERRRRSGGKEAMRRETRFSWGTRTYVMGILNVTPDSFSGDGLVRDGRTVESAVEQARRFLAAGADILDIDRKSTRLNSSPYCAPSLPS